MQYTSCLNKLKFDILNYEDANMNIVTLNLNHFLNKIIFRIHHNIFNF